MVGPPVILRLSRLGSIHVSCFKCFGVRASEHTAVGAMRVSADTDAVAKRIATQNTVPTSQMDRVASADAAKAEAMPREEASASLLELTC